MKYLAGEILDDGCGRNVESHPSNEEGQSIQCDVRSAISSVLQIGGEFFLHLGQLPLHILHFDTEQVCQILRIERIAKVEPCNGRILQVSIRAR